MAKYPSKKEITDRFSAEEIAAKIDDLPSYMTSDIILASLTPETVTPKVLRAWADLCDVITQNYPAAKFTASEIVRSLTPEELTDKAIQALQADVYDERKQEEDA